MNERTVMTDDLQIFGMSMEEFNTISQTLGQAILLLDQQQSGWSFVSREEDGEHFYTVSSLELEETGVPFVSEYDPIACLTKAIRLVQESRE